MNPKILWLFAVIVFFVGLQMITAAASGITSAATYHISNTTNGQDCNKIGTWNSGTSTCTLTTDVTFNNGTDGVHIDSDGVTLDGNGHTLTGNNNLLTAGAYLSGRTGVIIKNLTVKQFYDGIVLGSSSGNTLSGNTTNSNDSGIYLLSSSNSNTISGNTAFLNTSSGIVLGFSSNSNTLSENTTSSNGYGIYLGTSSNNQVYRNHFLFNAQQAYVSGGSGNVFNLSGPVGGNYWSNFSAPSQGCSDANNNGFCDAAYAFTGGQDNLPWTQQDGWATYHISNTANGQDCTEIGTWDGATKTCTLTTDVTVNGADGLQIESDGITLDGSGHTLTGNNSTNTSGVYLSGRTGVTIKNLTVNQFFDGILITSSSGNTVLGNTVSTSNNAGIALTSSSNNDTLSGNVILDSNYGIYLHICNGNTLADNTSSNSYYGIYLSSASNSILSGNTVSVNSGSGVYLLSSSSNTLSGNTVSANNVGVHLESASNNKIYRNNFLNNPTQASVSGGSGNVFNLAMPDGGNYWSNWSTPDSDHNGIVDNPYAFTGGVDNVPWTQQNGWATYHISNATNGQDCTRIGAWDGPTKTCTMTTDVTVSGPDGIHIDSDGVTLNGNGHTLTGKNNTPGASGVQLWGRSGVTITHLTIKQFVVGIDFALSSNNTLSDNTVSSNSYDGIYLASSSTNALSGNTVSENNGTGTYLDSASSSNTLSGNTVNANGVGIHLNSASNNKIYHNNFLNNTTQASVSGGSGNVFNLVAPTGGNYWSDFNTPAQGCSDTNSDGFCDAAYTFTGGKDNLARTQQNGWRRDYFWTWYDNSGGDNWVLMANPASAAGDVYYNLSVAGGPIDLTGYGSGVVAPGGSIEPAFSGVTGGPVKASSLSGDKGIVSQRILWPKGGSSLEEVPGTDESKLSSDYLWTWYDNQSSGMTNWVMVANPSTSGDVYFKITVAGSDPGPGSSGLIAPGKNVTPTFPGLIGGPVEVKGCSAAFDSGGNCSATPKNLIASQRVLSGGGSAFNEVPGIPATDLSSDYLWTWYDNNSLGFTDWVMVSNPSSATADVFYRIEIAGDVKATGKIQPGKNVTPTFPGQIGGPVEVKSCSAAFDQYGNCGGTTPSVIASQRSLAGPSFEEVPGYSKATLASDYNWTWYDQQSPGSLNWVMIANPSDTPVTYQVKIGGHTMPASQSNPGAIPARGRVMPTFPDKMSGPVEVIASGNVMASQRVTWKGYFNEVLGTVLSQ